MSAIRQYRESRRTMNSNKERPFMILIFHCYHRQYRMEAFIILLIHTYSYIHTYVRNLIFWWDFATLSQHYWQKANSVANKRQWCNFFFSANRIANTVWRSIWRHTHACIIYVLQMAWVQIRHHPKWITKLGCSHRIRKIIEKWSLNSNHKFFWILLVPSRDVSIIDMTWFWWYFSNVKALWLG